MTMPSNARIDLDMEGWLEREALLHPAMRRHLPKENRRAEKLKRRRQRAACIQSWGGKQAGLKHVSDKQYIRDYGYLHGVGQEPEDIGREFHSTEEFEAWQRGVEGSFFTDRDGRRHFWKMEPRDESSSTESDTESEEGSEPSPPPPPKPTRAPLPLHEILDGGLAPLGRFVGSCRVELHSLQRAELNGQRGEILPLSLAPNVNHERVPVRLDGSLPGIMVRPQNVLILPPEDDASSDDGDRVDSDSEKPASVPAVPPSPTISEESVCSDGWSDDDDGGEPFEFVPAADYLARQADPSAPESADSDDGLVEEFTASLHVSAPVAATSSTGAPTAPTAKRAPALARARAVVRANATEEKEPRRWAARPCDQCARCGLFGHWASDCTEMVCGNCNTHGHLARDCPKPAPCFRCGELGHWAKQCPQRHANMQEPSNAETRWVLFEYPTIKRYRHHCSVCSYTTTVLTKASHGMPRHKCKGIGCDGSKWCEGSGQKPSHSELLSERAHPNSVWSPAPLGHYDAILDWKDSPRNWGMPM